MSAELNPAWIRETKQLFVDLTSKNDETRAEAYKRLCQFIQFDLPEASAEAVNAYVERWNGKIVELINSGDVNDKRGAVLAIVALLDIEHRDLAAAISRYDSNLRVLFRSLDVSLAETLAIAFSLVASRAPPGFLSQDLVSKHIDRCAENVYHQEVGRRLFSVHLMREFAKKCPTVVYQSIETVFGILFSGLRDSKQAVREAAASGFRACLRITADREVTRKGARSRELPSYYQKMFSTIIEAHEDSEATKKNRLSKEDFVHGSLLLLNELLVASNADAERVRQAVVRASAQTPQPMTTTSLLGRSVGVPLDRLGIGSAAVVSVGGGSASAISAAASSGVASVVGAASSAAVGLLGSAVGLSIDDRDDASGTVPVESVCCRNMFAEVKNYQTIGNKVFRHCSARCGPQVYQILLHILPRLAAFNPEKFSEFYLNQTMQFLLDAVRRDKQKSLTLQAIGLVALVVKDEFVPYLNSVMPVVRQMLPNRDAPPKSRTSLIESSVFLCISLIAKSVGTHLERGTMKELLDSMFASGLSPALTEALKQLALQIPALKKDIQDGLLKMLSLVLMNKPLRHPAARISSTMISSGSLGSSSSDVPPDATNIVLALRTLANFDFEGHSLIQFIKHISNDNFLANENKEIRLEAVKTCSQLLTPLVKACSSPDGASESGVNTISSVLTRLLEVGITDFESDIRKAVLLCMDDRFDLYLGQMEHLHTLFVALNDENFKIRVLALRTIGRLSAVNPAYSQPNLRRFLLQLLTDLDLALPNRQREQSAVLLSHLLNTTPRFVQPYGKSLFAALLPRLDSPQLENSSSPLTVALLQCVGELARICPAPLRDHIDTIYPMLLGLLSDQQSPDKREKAIWALGHVVSSSGFLVRPYERFPDLLNTLLTMMRTEHSKAIRRQVLRVIGCIGALDPFTLKIYLNEVDAVGDTQYILSLHEVEERSEVDLTQNELLVSVNWATFNEFYAACAFSVLMGLLRDPGNQNSSLTNNIVAAIMFMFSSLQSQATKYLNQVVPLYLDVVGQKSLSSDIRRYMISQLAEMVNIVKLHIKPFMPQIVKLMHEFWSEEDSEILISLIELLVSCLYACGTCFREYLPVVLPNLLNVLNNDSCEDKRLTTQVLDAVQQLGPNAEEYLHVLVPAIVKIVVSDHTPLSIKTTAVETLSILNHNFDLGPYASRIVLPTLKMVQKVAVQPATQDQRDLLTAVMDLFSSMFLQLGTKFMTFYPIVDRVIRRCKIQQHQRFDLIANKVSKNTVLSDFFASDPALLRVTEIGGRLSSASTGGRLHHSTSRRRDKLVGSAANAAVAAASSTANAAAVSAQQNQKLQSLVLQRSWQISSVVSKDDWHQWLRNLTETLIRESPSVSIRACRLLAQANPAIGKQLFNAAFVSCWSELPDSLQDELIQVLEQALSASKDVPEISQTILNLSEFMDHRDSSPLPLSVKLLADKAIKTRVYAKALYYKETEFRDCVQSKFDPSNYSDILESLISINNKLGMVESAEGVLQNAASYFKDGLRNQEFWFEKLQDWTKALMLYERNIDQHPNTAKLVVGRLRCLEALGEWTELEATATEKWSFLCENTDQERDKVAAMAINACWSNRSWDKLCSFLKFLPKDSYDANFFNAVYAIHLGVFDEARCFLDRSRDILDADIANAASDSYMRSYSICVSAQTLTELEEVMEYRLETDRRPLIRECWSKRLESCDKQVEDWWRLLQVRSLVLNPVEQMHDYLKFASLCRKNSRTSFSLRVIASLMGFNPAAPGAKPLAPAMAEVSLAYAKHLWFSGQKAEATNRLTQLIRQLVAHQDSAGQSGGSMTANSPPTVGERRLLAKSFLKLANWYLETRVPDAALGGGAAGSGGGQQQSAVNSDDDQIFSCLPPEQWRGGLVQPSSPIVADSPYLYCMHRCLGLVSAATDRDAELRKAWARFGLMSYESLLHLKTEIRPEPEARTDYHRLVAAYSLNAVRGFVKSLCLCTGNSLQDSLRLINLLFEFGAEDQIVQAVNDGLHRIRLENWLLVIQQMLARIDSPRDMVNAEIVNILVEVGKAHPQAMINPLILAFKSGGTQRRRWNCNKILYNMESHSARLVSEGFMLNEELIRLAITWAEMWYESIEEASRAFFGETKDIRLMLQILQPLHELMTKPPETLQETAFHQEYARELQECLELCAKYQRCRHMQELNVAWDIYYNIFRRLGKQVPAVQTLELSYSAPRLANYGTDWELAVPGTYLPRKPVIRVAGIKPTLKLINSKQKPRILTVNGSDGHGYTFLLKGHEDIRQDERVMQLFGLTNSLLMSNIRTVRCNLTIQRMSIIPLSTNTGLIGWVPNSDTLHTLIRDYREKKKIRLNLEHWTMLKMAPEFDKLTIAQKTEVFEYGLTSCEGDDLAKIIWDRSPTAELWFERRTNYIRSLATMSMVGYILGLGDRHPSNIMLNRDTGKIVHIDFGDCFEVAMHREKFPEQVPFRLTRMLIKALEVTGIEGCFRQTCILVMNLLRENKDSIMAVLEAFVYDPLLQWILLDHKREFGDAKKTMQNFRRPADPMAAVADAAAAAVAAADPQAAGAAGGGGAGNAGIQQAPGVDAADMEGYNPWRHHLVNGPWFGNYEESKQLRKRSRSGVVYVEKSGIFGLIFSARPPPFQSATTATGGYPGGPGNNGGVLNADSSERSSRQNSGATSAAASAAAAAAAAAAAGAVVVSKPINSKATDVIGRVRKKLTGQDFNDSTDSRDFVNTIRQVDMLLANATSNQNLCQMYIGWCPFW
ncbi:hypothetical protein BOX15_Mlig009522g5 [Macrostomum lignano]|uniref:Serine/threonine-protein kinase TOR n=1 Tax=Macrostomum lignano TaxID=282301 RepID=A0A267FJ91_9PLAT|nr:hypothetical protein BOX15_Mlig009522g5 [Macrostomum lignano]